MGVAMVGGTPPGGVSLTPYLTVVSYWLLVADYRQATPVAATRELPAARALQLNGTGMRVLIVDDSAGLREIIRIGLQARGYEVLQAADGREALRLLRERSADVIITDLYMPEMDGLETLEVVRQEFPDTPVVAMSGVPTRTGTDFLEVAHELGAALVLRKPFTIPELVAAVERVARKH